jgi:hypothetical protein
MPKEERRHIMGAMHPKVHHRQRRSRHTMGEVHPRCAPQPAPWSPHFAAHRAATHRLLFDVVLLLRWASVIN